MLRKTTNTTAFLFTLASMVIAIEPAAGAVAEGSVIEATITSVDYDYGNLQTDLPASAMRINIGEPFTFSCKNVSYPATWVSWYEDVAEGEWLGLSGQGDQVQIAVSFGHADEISGCGVGDTVVLEFTPGG